MLIELTIVLETPEHWQNQVVTDTGKLALGLLKFLMLKNVHALNYDISYYCVF